MKKSWSDLAPENPEIGFLQHPILLRASMQNNPDVVLSFFNSRFLLLRTLNSHLISCLEQIDLTFDAPAAVSSLSSEQVNDIIRNIISYEQTEGHAIEATKRSITSGKSYQSSSIKTTMHSSNILGTLLSKGRSLIFNSIRSAFINRLIERTEVQGSSKFELVISRSRASKFASKGECDNEGRWSVFGQAFRRIHGMAPSVLRRSNQIWDTIFAGERAQDAGGPYREAWTAIVQDLMSPCLPLLKPSPNNVSNAGYFSECFIINPDVAMVPIHMEMLIFLGKMMGSAARSKSYLDIILAPVVWKLILNEEVSFNDMKTVDLMYVKTIQRLRRREDVTESSFCSKFADITFSLTNLAGREVDLVPSGKQINLRWSTIDSFCLLAENYRINEMKSVCQAIRLGLESQIPPSALTLLTGSELEEMVCGKPIIDIELLKSCTEYSQCSPTDQHIIWFWEVMEREFSQEDRKAFIKFAWGRSRLPLTKSAFSQVV